jgi:CIC family chloride channel protein
MPAEPPVKSPTPRPRPGRSGEHTLSISVDQGILSLARSLDVTSLWRWAWLSILVGVLVGLAACAFYFTLEWLRATLLFGVAGFRPPLPGGEAVLAASLAEAAPSRPWLLAILPGLGGLGAGLLAWRFAADAAGHGTDAMIDAYHNKQGKIPIRVPVVKLVASIFTLGTGGSAGREGPISQIGAGVGSSLGSWLGLSERERRLLLLAGASAGISALFRTPLGASLWALEVLYREDFESEALFPCLTASVTAYSLFISIFGPGQLFTTESEYGFRPLQLGLYGLMALLLAGFGLVWIKIFYGAERHLFAPLPVPRWLKPALGGLGLGALALLIPASLGIGYGWVQDALRPLGDPERLLPEGLRGAAVLAGIALAKMVATALTVSSGGSGGVFAPSIVIGGLLGGAFGMAANALIPELAPQPGAFVLVGMATFYGGVGHVPLSALVIVCELAGSYDLLVPLMLGVMITYLLLRRFSLYEKQVRTLRDSPVHADKFTIDVLEDLRVADVAEKTPARTVRQDLSLRDFLRHVSDTAEWFFAVVDPSGRPVGMLSLADVRAVIADDSALDVLLVGDAMLPLYSVAPAASLRTAIAVFAASGQDRLPVIDPQNPSQIVGLLGQRAVLAAYNTELLRRRLGVVDSIRFRSPPAS